MADELDLLIERKSREAEDAVLKVLITQLAEIGNRNQELIRQFHDARRKELSADFEQQQDVLRQQQKRLEDRLVEVEKLQRQLAHEVGASRAAVLAKVDLLPDRTNLRAAVLQICLTIAFFLILGLIVAGSF